MKRNLTIYLVLTLVVISPLVGWFSVPRVKAATYTVTTVADNGDNMNPTSGSLRKAIIDANNSAGLDTISFNIAGAGVQTITLPSQLPTITDAVVIDGYTQPGASANTQAVGSDATLLIELNGTSAGAGVSGLTISAGGSTVRGLVINRFSSIGIHLLTNGGNTIEGCYVGTNAAGTANLNNSSVGIYINGVPNNLIGGTTPAARNVISGNLQGMQLASSSATGNTVQGNYIGTDKTGTVALGNTPGDGVMINAASNNTIGGTVAGAGNLISGNAQDGVGVSGGNNNTVLGNLIGTDATGTLDRGNARDGVLIRAGSSGNTIGGTVAGARNVISGNNGEGVEIIESSSNNQVQGNYIGTNATGTADLGNSLRGIAIDSGTNNTIGGTTAAARNVISGNDLYGIYLLGGTSLQILGNFIGTNAAGTAAIGNSSAGIEIRGGVSTVIGGTTGTSPGGACTGACNLISGNGGIGISHANGAAITVQGNFVGTDVNGTADLGNGSTGIGLNSNATGDIVGGTTAAARNIVSGNNSQGIEVGGSGGGHTVLGNFIGLNSAGTAAISNSLIGVSINGSGNTIGGTVAGAGNVISGHSNRPGIEIGGSANNIVQGNLIGTDASGILALPNQTGIQISLNASNTLIGGATSGARNIISGNTGDGILIGRPSNANCCSSSNNTVQGNFIGIDVTGTADLGNGGNGVVLRDSPSNIVGGTMAGERNVISGNNASGIRLDKVFGGTTGNLVRGNYIGTDASGTSALGNSASGLFIADSFDNTVGGSTAGAGNLIAFNTGNGISLNSGTGNAIRGNSIFSNTGLGIDLGGDGVTPNDACDGDGGANNLQNFPVINSINRPNGNIVINGTLNSSANTTFTLDFYQSPMADPSGFGEGQTYLGSTTATTDGSCVASFSATLPAQLGGVITVTATDAAGNTSEFSQVVGSPTAIDLISFTAASYPDGVLLEWQTGFEVDNLGFHLYREEAGKRTMITPQLIAGSALAAGSGVAMNSGRSYAWFDKLSEVNGAEYWLESVDLNGESNWQGPVTAQLIGDQASKKTRATLLSKLGRSESLLYQTLPLEAKTVSGRARPEQITLQTDLAAQTAVKIAIKQEGWYRVSSQELIAAGLDANADPRFLQMFVEGREQPVAIIEDQQTKSPSFAVEFYARGVDTAYSNSRIYWLTVGAQAGLRIKQVKESGAPPPVESFAYTVERKDRTIYFSALRNGEAENFFGAVIARDTVVQDLFVQHLDQMSPVSTTLEVALQGVTLLPHEVKVRLNGTELGVINFMGQGQGVASFSVRQSQLHEGLNQVTLTAQSGPSDISLVDYLRLTYQHTYNADSDTLRLTASGNQAVTINGFTGPQIKVIDITDPNSPEELLGEVQQQRRGYGITVTAPGDGLRTVLALTDSTIKHPAAVVANEPSTWRSPANRANLIIITRRDFFADLEPLKKLRQKQGLSIATVDVEDIYDEFSFGEKSPKAVKDFLTFAYTNWKRPPRFVLFAGDASLDPKNYLGYGDSDLVPTKLVDTEFNETASDDWFADFDNDRLAELAVGRLPVRSASETAVMVSKICSYENSKGSQEALLVADTNDGYSFEDASHQLLAWLPQNLSVAEINRGHLDAVTAKQQLFEAINRGQKLVNYTGHGSVDLWRGNLLTSGDVANLRNAENLSVFVMMTCLNGYFQDAALDSLAESLMKTETGGAVAVWASSGLTLPTEQAVMNREFYRLLFSPGTSSLLPSNKLTIGEATQKAKLSVQDSDVRRTWILFGDPTMKLR
jgi:hypothetical protein